MAQQPQPQQQAFASPGDEIAHLRLQNEQLRKIIEKQHNIVQNLQKDNIRLVNERVVILKNYQSIDKEFSLVRQKKTELLNETSVSEDDLNSINSETFANGPVPPPRSPFRRVISDEGPSVSSPPSSPGPLDLKWARAATVIAEPPSLSRMMMQSQAMRLSTLEVEGNSLYLRDAAVKVVESTVKATELGKEVESFLIVIGRRKPEAGSFHELWRVEKHYSDVLGLDAKLKMQQNSLTSSQISKLPERALFNTHAPTKVDQRKMALESYIRHALLLPWDDVSDLREFLSTNVVKQEIYTEHQEAPTGHKEGYLTKRGKNFGGWKRRYFVMQDGIIDYYESKEGNHLGTIRLTNAQIGRQLGDGVTVATDDSNSNSNSNSNIVYRHAFLLVEQKRPGSSTVSRHILCAGSDQERDEWVEVIIQSIRAAEDELGKSSKCNKKKLGKPFKSESHPDNKSSTDVGAAASSGTPTVAAVAVATVRHIPSVSLDSTASIHLALDAGMEYGRSSLDHHLSQKLPHAHPPAPYICRRTSMSSFGRGSNHPPSSPRGTSLVAEVDPFLAQYEQSNDKKSKSKANRVAFWGKKMFNSDSNNNSRGVNSAESSSSLVNLNNNSSRTNITPVGLRGFFSRSSHDLAERKPSHPRGRSNSIGSRQQSNQQQHASGSLFATSEVVGPKQVFGVPVEEAVRVSRVIEGYELPSVVYRCIEYLDAKTAVMEEGLYRLSGSNNVMKSLRQRFNFEGDVDLLSDEEDYDVHVVAGLLKMWLRELPNNVLTRDYYPEFLHVIDLLDRKDRVDELGRLVSQLPLANYTLLRALTAHLLRVVQNADLNKMTVRNVSIVFSATLGIPTMIFNLFLSEFGYIFWTTENGDPAPRTIESGACKLAINHKPTPKTQEEPEERSNRNSVNYVDGAPSSIVELERSHFDGTPVMDEDEDELTLSFGLRSSEEDSTYIRSERTYLYG